MSSQIDSQLDKKLDTLKADILNELSGSVALKNVELATTEKKENEDQPPSRQGNLFGNDKNNIESKKETPPRQSNIIDNGNEGAKPHAEAVEVIQKYCNGELKLEKLNYNTVAEALKGKYFTPNNKSTKWKGTTVSRIMDKKGLEFPKKTESKSKNHGQKETQPPS